MSDDIARKMDRLLVVCEAARAEGWTIAPGNTVNFDAKICCPLGAIPVLAGYFQDDSHLYADCVPAIDPEDVAREILDVEPAFAIGFIQGFDGGKRGTYGDDLGYLYGKSFRGLYRQREDA